MAGMSRDLGRDVPGSEKLYASLQFPNAVILNAVRRRNTQKGTNERKWAQKSANASPRKSAKECVHVKFANNQVWNNQVWKPPSKKTLGWFFVPQRITAGTKFIADMEKCFPGIRFWKIADFIAG